MPHIDAEHRGPLINVAAWFLLVTMIIFVASKIVTKWRMVRRLQNDDYLLSLAMLIATGQCIAASQQVQHGLGQAQTSLSPGSFDKFQKASYADEFFYIGTIYLSKLAALQFLIILARPNEPNLRRAAVRGTLGILLLWMAIAVISIAFQCKIPTPWNEASGQCFDQVAFWSANAAVDVVSTLIIGLMPIYLLYNLQLPRESKRLAMLSFTPNLSTIPLTVLRLIYLIRAIHSSDYTKASFDTELITVIHTNYSIIASSLPFLKPFFDSLAIGLMTNDIRLPINNEDPTKLAYHHRTGKDGGVRRTMNPFAILGSGSRYASKRNNMTAYGSGWTRSIIISTTGKGGGGSHNNNNNHNHPHHHHHHHHNHDSGNSGSGQDHELRDLERYGSRERMVINQTRTAEVTSEPRSSDPDDDLSHPRVPEASLQPSTVKISAG